MTNFPVFDGHNDMLLRLIGREITDPVGSFGQGDGGGHIDLPRARAGGFAGGLFAAFPPPLESTDMSAFMQGPNYEVPTPPELPLAAAQASTARMFAILIRLEKALPDDLQICRSVSEIRGAMAADRLAAVMHIEGCEAIDPDFAMLDVLHAAGLRSLGIVWSRPNAFAHGVPFRFPGNPDTGPGLTEAGRELVKACNARKILIDLSHLNEKGFWDVASLTDAPLVATHSNVHALCATTRNLTDRQLAAIAESRGLVGLNFATCFLRPDGAMRADTNIDLMRRHLDYLIGKLGEDGVGLGSDFDGAIIPGAIDGVAGLPAFVSHLSGAGYSEALLRKITHENWLNLLERVWA
jgi:membrane dipeptidase